MTATRANILDVAPDANGRARRYTDAQTAEVGEYLYYEGEEALAARYRWEANVRDCLRMYHAIPQRAVRDTPIPNAPNIEVPIGAIAADAIYAEGVDLIFQISPVVTCRAIDKRYVAHAKALQRLINFSVENEWGLRQAVMNALADDTQLGTMVYYIPYQEIVRRNLTGAAIAHSGPRILSIGPENFLVPGSAPMWQEDARWMALRSFLTPQQLNLRAKMSKWDIDGVMAIAWGNSVRETRDRLARTQRSGVETRDLCEIIEYYCTYDLDGDGIPEDLYVVMDRASRKVMKMRPDPYDRRRPFESAVYQPQPHLFYGIGVIEMLREFERAATEIHNARVLNMLLANARVWVSKEGVLQESEEIWPGKVIHTANPKEDFMGIAMGDVYTSAIQAESILMQYAERRSGVGDLAQGRSAALGSRTPGITALSATQSVLKRFTPAFDGMRIATSRAVQQCTFRLQERALMNDPFVRARLFKLLGPEDGALVWQLFQDPDFDNGVLVELTASSATVNREADRQNAIMLMNVLGSYYKQLLELMQLATAPGMPAPIVATAMKIVDAAAEAVDRTVRTFDQIRDPEAFVVRLQDVLQGAEQVAPAVEMANLQSALAGQAGIQPNGNGGGPAPQPLDQSGGPPPGTPLQ